MSQSIFQVNKNKMELTSIDTFCNINGRFKDYTKDCFFLRYIGLKDSASYLEKIKQLDLALTKRNCGYYRVTSLSNYIPKQELTFYQTLYDALSPDASHLGCRFQFQDPVYEKNLVTALYQVFTLYQQEKVGCSDSILRNFGIKILYWIDQYLPSLYTPTYNMAYSPKFLCSGSCTLQEYLFLYYLVLTGCDVLYLNSEADITLSENLKKLSQALCDIHREKISLPDYPQQKPDIVPSLSRPAISIAHPTRPNPGSTAPAPRPAAPVSAAITGEPLSYEALASFATSVVMIGVFNEEGKCYKTGSGVMIGEEGYLITNFHVVRGGAFYSIRIEEEEETYETNELIKYHSDFDLALLRIERRCRPIPLYPLDATPLARGQKVVAIGSPLGLFNSVSDGIISGFRELDHVPMIQFTAATSHGSSGGALLNMQGELIGLCTAGFDDGQNLNLAVDYKILNMFLKGFLH